MRIIKRLNNEYWLVKKAVLIKAVKRDGASGGLTWKDGELDSAEGVSGVVSAETDVLASVDVNHSVHSQLVEVRAVLACHRSRGHPSTSVTAARQHDEPLAVERDHCRVVQPNVVVFVDSLQPLHTSSRPSVEIPYKSRSYTKWPGLSIIKRSLPCPRVTMKPRPIICIFTAKAIDKTVNHSSTQGTFTYKCLPKLISGFFSIS